MQANSVADALRATFGVPLVVSGAMVALATALVVLGGIQLIAKTASVIVPTMIVFYLVGGLIVLALNWRTLPRHRFPHIQRRILPDRRSGRVYRGNRDARHPIRHRPRRLQ